MKQETIPSQGLTAGLDSSADGLLMGGGRLRRSSSPVARIGSLLWKSLCELVCFFIQSSTKGGQFLKVGHNECMSHGC